MTDELRDFFVDELSKLGLSTSGTIRTLESRYENALKSKQNGANVQKVAVKPRKNFTLNMNLKKPKSNIALENDYFPFTNQKKPLTLKKKANKLPKLKKKQNDFTKSNKNSNELPNLNQKKKKSSFDNDSLFSIESVLQSEESIVENEEQNEIDVNSEISGLSFLNFDVNKIEQEKKIRLNKLKEKSLIITKKLNKKMLKKKILNLKSNQKKCKIRVEKNLFKMTKLI